MSILIFRVDQECHHKWMVVEIVFNLNFFSQENNFVLLNQGLRMTSPGARMPSNQIGHPGPGGPMSNAYRPQVMSPTINQPGPRMYMTNSPGVKIKI